MCLWLITACLGVLPTNPAPPNIFVVQGVPTPILQPTTAATTPAPTTTTAKPPPTTTAAATAAPMTTAPPNTAAPTTGSPQIDPRLGTTPGLSAAIQLPPITSYNAQVTLYDTAVKFPRERRSLIMRMKNLYDSFNSPTYKSNKHNIRKRQSCSCVPSGTCVNSGGAGMIDIRIVTPGATVTQCSTGQTYCCGATTKQNTIACGTLQSVPSPGANPGSGQANYGEYPWQALVLTKQNDYIAGGVLIDQLNVLTVTHRMTSHIVSGTAPNVKVRLGEWDAGGSYEPIPYQEYTVQKVFSHPSYNPNTLQYDIAVLRLSAPVPFSPESGSAATINRACLPPNSNSVYTGLRCWVSGWGKNMFGMTGQYQQIMKKVDVPIVAPATCQSQLQAARLGPNYVLDTTSFICAGGEANKDACTGDGGSGLFCQVNGQWVVVGLVAWGLGCANPNVPAAYVNIAALLPWIQQQVATA
ncbi:unnamed protein product [Parnassius apollo]|uniref:(apollo) hypothetical protein n=1 Tax=Parnassius apollo TaxID=110799 RepID=A0A8S3WSL2_PARAO|nr:unnamed protein product [Parnassius apollo]